MTEHAAAYELDARRRRAAKNQSVFREVNERISELTDSSLFAQLICECMLASCDERVALTEAEYEHIRARPNRFFVLAGHEFAEIEDVVETTDRYLIVEKLGVAQRPPPSSTLGLASALN